MSRLRRLLWPFRPILRPIWHGLAWLYDRTRPVWALGDRIGFLAGQAADRRRGRHRPIRALRRFELVDLGLRVPYYRPRLTYMSASSRIAEQLIRERGLTTALELGPYLRSMIVGADIVDVREQPDRVAEGRTIIHDATHLPWPVPDRAYDLFVALQVFEHLGTHQAEVFREVRRVARHAILSLPIDWVMANPANCHHGLTEERVLAWFAPVVPTRIELGNGGHRKRLIYVFEDLPPATPAAEETTIDGVPGEPDRIAAGTA
jgi:methyltransferase family protein